MSDAYDPVIQECAACGALIDITDEDPLALIHCPTCGAAMRVHRMFDHFEPIEVLGAGGMGAVYRAQDTNLNRSVALKLLRREHSANPELIQSFAAEAALTASISHPNVVKVYSTGLDHGVFYIAMELVDKGSLDDLMGLQGKVGELQVLDVGIQIAQGLSAAARRGLIHRDVKPGNILFADAHTSKIVDFGLAMLQEEASKAAGEVWGTPYYVAPEKLDNPPVEDFRSDMYSLGATLFHAIAGRPPFEAETASMVALKHLKSQNVSLQAFAPGVSSATAYVINKTLHKDPNQRFQSYEELVQNLQYAKTQLLTVKQRPAQPKPRVVISDIEQEKAMSWLTFLMVALMVAGGVGTYMYRDKLFGTKKTKPKTTMNAQQLKAQAETDLKFARRQIAFGKYPEAAKALQKLGDGNVLTQPNLNWATMNAALAFYLAGQPKEAEEELAKIEKRGPQGKDEDEKRVSEFFLEVSKRALGKDPIKAEVAKSYNRFNHEPFAFLLFAAKDWSQGASEDAGAFFKEFQDADPNDDYPWMKEYQQRVASAFMDDFTTFQTASESVKKAGTNIDRKKEALKLVTQAKGMMRMKSKLSEQLTTLEEDLKKQIKTEEEDLAKADAEMADADKSVIADVETRVKTYSETYRFADAHQIVFTATVNTEKGKDQMDVLFKRTQALADFKGKLIDDINAKGFPKPVNRTKGQGVVAAGFKRASDQQAEVAMGTNFVPVPWGDVTPESMVEMAQYFIAATKEQPALSEREWALGAFLDHLGKKAEAQVLLKKAAEANADLKENLKYFPAP